MSASPDGKRKSRTSFLRRSTLNPLTTLSDDSDKAPPKSLKKKLSKTLLSNKPNGDEARSRESLSLTSSRSGRESDSPHNSRTQVLRKSGRTASLLGSLGSFRSFRTNGDDDTPPATASSSKAPSFSWRDFGPGPSDVTDIGRNRNVLHHGEAQTNTGVFRKKKEYLVLTETHLVRFKNQGRASETFHSIPPQPGRSLVRHASGHSSSTVQDSYSLQSDTSGDKVSGIPLEHVVAVFPPDESRGVLAIEIAYLDSDAGQGSSILLAFTDVEDKDLWLRSIRYAANMARLIDTDPVAPKLSEYAARVVEREQDYDVTNYRIYKIVKRSPTKSAGKSSADDFTRANSTICFLVIGIRKVHIILLPKNIRNMSAPSLNDLNEGGSFGILTLTAMIVSGSDDTFSLAFRTPFNKPRVFQLASLASPEIALRLRYTENVLRPQWIQRPYIFEIPRKVEEEYIPDEQPQEEDHESFDRTLIAFCVAYGVNAQYIRYSISYSAEDSPRFQLLEPSSAPNRGYSALELLAVLRSLRYNDSFGSISFFRISFDSLNGVYDRHGSENVCLESIYGPRLVLDIEEQRNAPILVQEIRALALGSRRLRRIDFSHTISTGKSRKVEAISVQPSAGFTEALAPICKKQATNVDWITLNGVHLDEKDLEYLVDMAAEKSCHFRALEVSRCGLTDRGMSLLLDAFKAQDNTLEVIDMSENTLRLVPSILSRQLDAFGFIRKLDLSNLAVTAAAEPIVALETLLTWRLEDLRLRGIALNEQTIEALCGYLTHSQSEVLRELVLSNCSLTGRDVALLMQSMRQGPDEARYLHLDVSENLVEERYDRLSSAIARGLAPTHLSIRSVEWQEESYFRDLLLAVASNTTIRYLDLAKTALPAGASEETCKALEKVFTDNNTLEDLDISGEDSRLEVSKLGVGINEALYGLKRNSILQILRIQNQKLGVPGASALADVLTENKGLRQLHCDSNSISLSGFTDLVNSLASNRTLLYLPRLVEGRDAALRQTEQQIKLARTRVDGTTTPVPATRMSSMRRTFANMSLTAPNVGRSNAKTAAVPQWTEQDVQAALRLVSEGWEAQANRLDQFLDRNWKIFQGMPAEEAEAELHHILQAQRPGTAGSLSKILDKVGMETTPTMEKQIEFGYRSEDGEASSTFEDEDTTPPRAEKKALERSESSASTMLGDFDIDSTPFGEEVFGFSSENRKSRGKAKENRYSSGGGPPVPPKDLEN